MNITDLRRELNDEPTPEPLDPEILAGRAEVGLRGARRTRRLLVVGAAIVAVALGLTTAVRSGWLGRGTQPYVAGAPAGPVSTPAPMGSAIVITTGPSGGEATVTPVGSIPATGVIPAVPYVAVGPAPAVRTIPDNTWVEVVAGTWVATWKTKIIVVNNDMTPSETPQVACGAGAGSFGCRGTVDNTNRDASLSNVQSTGSNVLTVASSSFSGSPASTKAILPEGTAYWGVLWRLEGVAGWTFAVWTTPSLLLPSITPGSQVGFPVVSPTYKTYDDAGTVTGSFPA
jgi:hypothetical protein